MDQELESFLREWSGLCPGSRGHHIPCTPEMAAHQGQTIRARRLGLVIPRRDWSRELAIWAPSPGQHGDEREPGQQDGGGARHGLVRPLARGVAPELSATLLNGALDRPAHDDPRQDWPWGRLPVGTEERFRPQLPLGSAPQNTTPLDR